MSTIEKLGIIGSFLEKIKNIENYFFVGIRSYNPDRLEHIEFFKPLTIIWGPNGAGKTVNLLFYLNYYAILNTFYKKIIYLTNKNLTMLYVYYYKLHYNI